MDIMVTNNQRAERFEISRDKSMAVLEYLAKDGLLTLLHTEVPEELEGNGFGGKLVKAALEHAKRNNLRVVAKCEFAKSYIARHKEYSFLLSR